MRTEYRSPQNPGLSALAKFSNWKKAILPLSFSPDSLLALLRPLLGRAAPVIEVHCTFRFEGEVGHDKAYSGE